MKKPEDRRDFRKFARPDLRMLLPGFITDEEIGLGDVIARATSYVGMSPCGDCRRRAAALNRWFAFTGRAKQPSS